MSGLSINIFGPPIAFTEEDQRDLSGLLKHPALAKLINFHVRNEYEILFGRNPLGIPAAELKQHFAYMQGVRALANNLLASSNLPEEIDNV